jgi:hypothetical protein
VREQQRRVPGNRARLFCWGKQFSRKGAKLAKKTYDNPWLDGREITNSGTVTWLSAQQELAISRCFAGRAVALNWLQCRNRTNGDNRKFFASFAPLREIKKGKLKSLPFWLSI